MAQRGVMNMRRAAGWFLSFLIAFAFPLALSASTASQVQPVRDVLLAPQTHDLWSPPLGSSLEVAKGFDLPLGPYRAGHRGIDLVASVQQTVFAPAAGVVSFVGTVVDRPLISVRVGEHTVYSIEPVESGLAVGDVVSRFDVLGSVAEGGHCSYGCVHLGVRVAGEYVNSMRFFWPKPQLLPW